MVTQDIVRLIQSAVAPVFLLSGVGVTLGVLTNRLARIVDRARLLEERLASLGPFADDPSQSDDRRSALDANLAVLARRARYINVAITLCTLSALLVSLVVILLFANAFLQVHRDAYALVVVCIRIGVQPERAIQPRQRIDARRREMTHHAIALLHIVHHRPGHDELASLKRVTDAAAATAEAEQSCRSRGWRICAGLNREYGFPLVQGRCQPRHVRHDGSPYEPAAGDICKGD